MEIFLTNLSQGFPLNKWVNISEPFYVEADEFIYAVNTFLNISLEEAGQRAVEMGAPREKIQELVIKAKSWRKSVPDVIEGLYRKLVQERVIISKTAKPILEGIRRLDIVNASSPFSLKPETVFAVIDAAA